MGDPVIQLSCDRHEVRCTEVVRVLLGWHADRQPEAVRIELRWRTEGRGDRNSGVGAVHRHGPEQGPIPPQLEAALRVPGDGPVSYDGQMIRVIWEVRAVLEMRLRTDPSAAVPLQVLPAVIPRGTYDWI